MSTAGTLLCLLLAFGLPAATGQERKASSPPTPPKPAKPVARKSDPWVLVRLSPEALTRAEGLVAKGAIRRVDPEEKGDPRVLTRRSSLVALEKAGLSWRDETLAVPYRHHLPRFRERSRNPVKLVSGRIHTDDGYHDHAMVAAILQAFARRHPRICRLHTIGTTWQGRPILALKISDRAGVEEDEPAILFNGSHHGSELLSTEMVLDTIEYLLNNYRTGTRARTWVDTYEIWCVPLVNPDGNHRFLHLSGSGRKNGRDLDGNGRDDRYDGVDLNRNYPFRWHSRPDLDRGAPGSKDKGKGKEQNKGRSKGKRPKAPSSGDPRSGRYRGPAPASEPETRAMMKLAGEQRFFASISYHTSSTKILVPYTIDGLKNPEPSVAWDIGRRMAELSRSCRPDRKYRAVRNLYPVDGVDQDWHYHTYGTLAFLLEGPRTNPPYARDRNPMVRGVRPAWFHLLDVLIKGPAVSGHLRDAATGKPLAGEVGVREIRTFSGERHPTHPVSGRFDRALPEPGVYHFIFSAPGYRERVVPLEVGTEWLQVEVALDRDAPPR